ncbi:MAG: MFS transporter [Candidatus Nanopelagicales bacterium]
MNTFHVPPRLPQTVIVVFAAAQFLAGLDMSIMNVALPAIQQEFDAGMMAVQWSVMAYMIAGAALALPFGALGDRLGRRRLYLIGTTTFAVGSLVCATAPSMGFLIAGRAIAGAGSVAMGTLALAMLVSSVPRDQGARLIGMWAAVTAGASALGPIVGGVMVTAFGWRSVFAMNVILLAAIIPVVRAKVTADAPASSERTGERQGIDGLGIGLLVMGMMLIAGGLSLLEFNPITDPRVWAPAAIGLAAIAALALQQRRTPTPLTDWAVVRRSPIPVTLSLLVILGMVLAGAFLQQALLIQNVLGFTPLLAGFVLFAASTTLIAFSPLSPRIMARIGLGPTCALGLGCAALALFLLSLVEVSTGPLTIAGDFLLLGAGLGIAMPATQAGTMGVVPREAMGAVSGFLSLISLMSAVLGISVIGAISAHQVRSAWEATSSSIADAASLTSLVVSGEIPELAASQGAQVAALAGQAYLVGVNDAMRIAAVAVALAGLLAWPALGHRGRLTQAIATDALDQQVEHVDP